MQKKRYYKNKNNIEKKNRKLYKLIKTILVKLYNTKKGITVFLLFFLLYFLFFIIKIGKYIPEIFCNFGKYYKKKIKHGKNYNYN